MTNPYPPTNSSSAASSPTLPTTTMDIDHTAPLLDRQAALCLSATHADVCFLVAGQRLPAHRLLLATHSDHFRTLLCGSSDSAATLPPAGETIELTAAECPSADAFRTLLRYVYSGRMPLAAGMAIDLVLDVLKLAHRFGLAELELAISVHLSKVKLDVGNVCAIVEFARLMGLDHLNAAGLQFMDRNSEAVLLEAGFRGLSSQTLGALFRRDSFCAPEVQIFQAVCQWSEANAATVTEDEVVAVRSLVRLDLIDVEQLLTVVRPTGFYAPNKILDVFDEIFVAKQDRPSRHRVAKWPERNVATSEFGAKVLGLQQQGDADGAHNNDGESTAKGYLCHPITGEASAEGICVELGTVTIINHVKLLLWAGSDLRSYRYYVELSVDRSHWERCVDHSGYDCRSWQRLYFPARPVKYVKLVGMRNSENTTFHVVSLQASFVASPEPVLKGFVAPRANVATVEHGAIAAVGSKVFNNILIAEYLDGTFHYIGKDPIIIQLGQPVWLDSMSFRLWDHNYLCYSYYVETSTDRQSWQMAVDRREQKLRSWQSAKFEARLVVYVRLVGTYSNSTDKKAFHVIQFECPSQTE